MGAWNCSINGNDTAQDLISEYRAAFYYNDVSVALEKIFNYVNSYIDNDEIPDFVYSLADFMWKKGILTPDIKEAAIRLIDENWGIQIWAEAGEKILKQRQKVLENFKKKLLSPMPAKKKITLGMNIKPIFNTGDIITFKLATKNLDCSEYSNYDTSKVADYDNYYVVLRKAYDHISYTSRVEPNVKDTWAVFQLIPKLFTKKPTLDEVAKFLDKPLTCQDMILTESNLYYFKKRNYLFLGNVTPKLIKNYQHSFNDVTSIYFSINKPWRHPEVDLIKKIESFKS